ncbi:MAG: hypothetical protein CR986_07985 [Ignavibacteriae bacterium]|nr:MAG: hypothetical protein CR986_07985 [Ignavibacteriota bacterium]
MIKKQILIFLFLFSVVLNAQISQDDLSSLLKSGNSYNLNQITVTIGGEFLVNGSFSASSTERVDQLVTRIYNTAKTAIMSQVSNIASNNTDQENSMVEVKYNTDDFALRNIEIIHQDGKKEIIDLAEFRLTGKFENNPYLIEGDLILFPPYDMENNSVTISGAVNKPTTFQFVEGDDLQKALFFARGINKGYKNVNKAEIYRLTDNGQTEDIIEVDLASNIKLQAGDRIRVLYKEKNNLNDKVLVLGEVENPGYIPIGKNSTRLKDVIKRAGGFTENASLKFAELFRGYDSYYALKKESIEKAFENQEISIPEKVSLMNFNGLEYYKMFRDAGLTYSNRGTFNIDLALRRSEGVSLVDFTRLEDENSKESNYILKDGDVILIPKITNEVYVWGAVAQIGGYAFNSNYSVEDYINQAGGLTDIAYGIDEIYLIKGKSRNWINVYDNDNYKVEPGDFIYVNKEIPRDFQFYLGRIATYAAIVGSVTTVIILLNNNFFKK